jgi:hypothetical protein
MFHIKVDVHSKDRTIYHAPFSYGKPYSSFMYTRVYQKVSGLSRWRNNNKHSLRSNTKGYGSKTHYSDSRNSDTTVPSSRELYHLQFSFQAASPETFGYNLVNLVLLHIDMHYNEVCLTTCCVNTQCKILVTKPDEKRQLGRPRRRWEDNIKVGLREIWWEVVHWTIWLRIGDQWLDKWLLASQDGLCSTEVVIFIDMTCRLTDPITHLVQRIHNAHELRFQDRICVGQSCITAGILYHCIRNQYCQHIQFSV